MADNLGIMLTELPEATNIGDDDLMYIVQDNNSEKVKVETLRDTVQKIQIPDVVLTGDKACYVNRAIPSTDALAEGQKIVGATLAWNQLVDTGTTSVTIANGHKYIKYSGGTYTKGTSDGSAVSVSSGDLFFDITQMFGSTIADSLTVEQFSSLFPNSSYAYDAGSLQSVNVSAHKAYDSNAAEVSSITLDSSKEFRGLYKLVDGELQADGDVYEADGTVTRKFNISTYNGSENWTVHSSGRFYLNVLPSNITTNYAYKIKSITNYCEWLDDGSVYGNYFSIGGSGIYVNKISNNETLAEFQTRLSNNNLTVLYYINTPTIESATPYTNPQIVDADGTEEFVDYKVSQGNRDVAVPVGHESSFYDYTDGTITIPDLPFADGTYALSVTMNNGTPTFSWVSDT